MRALYMMLSVAVVMWMVLQLAECASSGPRRVENAVAPPPPAAPPPAASQPSKKKKKAVMIETATGVRHESGDHAQ